MAFPTTPSNLEDVVLYLIEPTAASVSAVVPACFREVVGPEGIRRTQSWLPIITSPLPLGVIEIL